MVSKSDPLNRTSGYEYSARGWVTKVTDPEGNARAFAFDENGNVIQQSQIGQGGTTSSGLFYDELDRLVRHDDQLYNSVVYAFDPAGNQTGVTSALGFTTSYAYNARNMLSQITQPDPDGAGSQTAAITTFERDQDDRPLVARDDPDMAPAEG